MQVLWAFISLFKQFFVWMNQNALKQAGRDEVELEQRKKNDELKDLLDSGTTADPDRVPDDEIIDRR